VLPLVWIDDVAVILRKMGERCPGGRIAFAGEVQGLGY
jgi:hypothetical protein